MAFWLTAPVCKGKEQAILGQWDVWIFLSRAHAHGSVCRSPRVEHGGLEAEECHFQRGNKGHTCFCCVLSPQTFALATATPPWPTGAALTSCRSPSPKCSAVATLAAAGLRGSPSPPRCVPSGQLVRARLSHLWPIRTQPFQIRGRVQYWSRWNAGKQMRFQNI